MCEGHPSPPGRLAQLGQMDIRIEKPVQFQIVIIEGLLNSNLPKVCHVTQ